MNPKLTRNTSDSVIGGVASGLSDYFNIDSWIIRLIFLILFFSGGGVLIYIIMWIAIPGNNNQSYRVMSDEGENNKRKSESGNIVAGVILITIGALFLVNRYFPEIDFRDLWPWSLIAVGVLILAKGLRNR